MNPLPPPKSTWVKISSGYVKIVGKTIVGGVKDKPE